MKVGSLVRTKIIDCNGKSVLAIVEEFIPSYTGVILRLCHFDFPSIHNECDPYLRMFNPNSLVVIKE